jgi:hypothetical protein
MAGTQVWPASGIRQAHGEMPAVSAGESRRRRFGPRLWSMLHAQALLDGGAGDPYDVTVIEDDRRRLAGRQTR